jgi:translocation and assembly module TamB
MSIKSILGAFIFIIFASFIALVFFIQTESFGAIATRVISDLSNKKFKTDLAIKNFSINLFPPGIELNQVDGQKTFSKDENLQFQFGKLGFYFGIFEIEENNLVLGEIRIADAFVNYQGPENEDEIKELDEKVINKIFEIPRKFPVRLDNLLIENSKVIIKNDSLDLKRVKIFNNQHFFRTRFHLANINPSIQKKISIDELWGDAEIYKSKIKIIGIKVQHDVHNLFVSGLIKNYRKIYGLEAKIKGEVQVYLKKLGETVAMPDFFSLQSGLGKSTFGFNYKDEKFSGDLELNLKEFKSGFLYADELTASIDLRNKNLRLNKLEVTKSKERLFLQSPVTVYDLGRKILLPEAISVSASNFSLTNALMALGPEFKILKGELTGDIVFQLKNKDLFFTPKDNFQISDLRLTTGADSDPFTILRIKKAKLYKTEFSVVSGVFQMHSTVVLPRSKLEINGMVGNGIISFFAPTTRVNLEDFGNISSLNIKGEGDISLNVSGSLEDTVINLSGKTQGFEILGYKLDKTEKDITLNLKDSSVTINKMESQFGKTQLSGNGTVNYETEEIALGITANQSNHHDLVQILNPILSGISFLPEDLDFNASVDVDIFGKYNLKNLGINTRVNFTDINAYGETFDSGSFNIHLLDKKLAFKQLYAQKGKGSVFGDFVFDLALDTFTLKYNWENLSFSALNLRKKLGLNLESMISGKASGGGPLDDYKLKVETTLFNTRSSAYTFDDSTFSLFIDPRRIQGEASIFGETIKSKFDLGLRSGIGSEFDFFMKTEQLKPFLVALMGQHLEIENFSGRIEFFTNAKFKDGFQSLDLTSNLKKLSFTHPEFSLDYVSDKPQLVVRDSIIKRWNFSIEDNDLSIKTQGSGEFGKKINLMNEISINSKILEILFSSLASANGMIKNKLRIQGDGSDYKMDLTSESSDVDLTIDQLPVPLNNLKYQVNYVDKRLYVNDFHIEFDKGSLLLKGDVFFDNQNPDVNLTFKLNRAEFPVLGKSSINLSGEGIILGNDFPYSVNGEIGIHSCQIINELNEFSSKSAGFSEVRYLPKNQESPLGKVLNLNLNVKAESPLRITNSLMDIALLGELRLTGKPDRPRGEGRLFVPPNSSRVFFKNNEYQITSADINFNPKKEMTNPEFDVQALTFISTYKVYPKAYGNLERFSFDLTSEPPLPRNSILSLIAFGYTNEIQSSLYAKDQQSLTQVGVGSFVFDRFKISDILNKQFGLQVNLGTVIEQSNTQSLLSGRNQGSGVGTVGRTRSATKIELKKRLDEALTLSVSSTMGGSIGQRQSMNLNYGLTKNLQIEGVYELRTNEEGQGDIIYNSIGGDLKFRRTFK